MNKHETVPVIIDGHVCQVDKGILPVVEWLNDLPGVTTEFSCEGDDSDGRALGPYVMFRIKKGYEDVLQGIASVLQSFSLADGELIFVPSSTYVPYPRYKIYWRTNEDLGFFYWRMGVEREQAQKEKEEAKA